MKDFLKSLNKSGVDYLLIGGVAVNYYGHVRNTDDLDVWVAINPSNADAIVAALNDFGRPTSQSERDLFLTPRRIARMGRPPLRIEISTSIAGVRFDECRARAVRANIDGVPVPVISLDDLRTNKRAAGRPKDLADLDGLTDARQ